MAPSKKKKISRQQLGEGGASPLPLLLTRMPLLLTRIFFFRQQLGEGGASRLPLLLTRMSLPLLLSHVMESIAFVPVMIGVLMFLFEFFADQVEQY